MKRFLTNPMRLAYLLGSIMTISAGIHWFVFFRPGMSTSAFNRPPAEFHSFQMLYTTFSFFVFGFLCRLRPRLLRPNSAIVLLSVLGLSEVSLFLAVRHEIFFYFLGFLQIVFFGALLWRLGREFKSGAKLELLPLSLSIIVGAVGSTLACFAFMHENSFAAYDLSLNMGLYGYLLIATILFANHLEEVSALRKYFWLVSYFAILIIGKINMIFGNFLAVHGKDLLHLYTFGFVGRVLILLSTQNEGENQLGQPALRQLALTILQIGMIIRVGSVFVPQFYAYRSLSGLFWAGSFLIAIFLQVQSSRDWEAPSMEIQPAPDCHR